MITISREDVMAAVQAAVPAELVRQLLVSHVAEVAEVVPLRDEPGNEGLRLLQSPTVSAAKQAAKAHGIPVRTLGRKKAYILRSELRAALAAGCADGCAVNRAVIRTVRVSAGRAA